MFLIRKPNPPSLFMKFGVDQHGLLVPFLRRVRGEVLQLNGSLKMLSLRPKATLRHQ
jgi:hypothetical protein